MKLDKKIKSLLLAAIVTGVGTHAFAEMTVDKSQGQLIITSDFEGTVIAKVIGPDDVVVVNERYSGNSFSWSPSSGPDGAYRYDVRVIEQSNTAATKTQGQQSSSTNSDYAGGSVEVRNGAMAAATEAVQ